MEEKGYMIVLGYFDNQYGLWHDDGEVKDIEARLFYISNICVKAAPINYFDYDRVLKYERFIKAFNDT